MSATSSQTIVSPPKHDSTFLSAVSAASDILPWSPLLCNHTKVGHSFALPENVQALYNAHQETEHMQGGETAKCAWFIRAKKELGDRFIKQREQEHFRRTKELAKEQAKTREEERIAKKQAEGYSCRRCRHPVKFDSNSKLHQHIRERHAKKPKPAEAPKPAALAVASTPAATPAFTPSPAAPHTPSPSEPAAEQAPSTPASKQASSSPPATPTSSHELAAEQAALITPPMSPKISWTAVAAIPPKPSCLPRSIKALPTPPATPSKSPVLEHTKLTKKSYLTVDDLYIMFHEKYLRKSFNVIQTNTSPAPSPPPRQMRITAYFKPTMPKSQLKHSTNTHAKPFSAMRSSKDKKWRPSAQAISSAPTSASQSARALPNQRASTPKTLMAWEPPHIGGAHFRGGLYPPYLPPYTGGAFYPYPERVFCPPRPPLPPYYWGY